MQDELFVERASLGSDEEVIYLRRGERDQVDISENPCHQSVCAEGAPEIHT